MKYLSILLLFCFSATAQEIYNQEYCAKRIYRNTKNEKYDSVAFGFIMK